MKILIETIPHLKQRYPTVGDWQWKLDDESPVDQVLHIRVSKMPDWRYEALIAIHELVEALLCQQAGVSEEEVDAFDKACIGSEPGDSPFAPYYRQHVVAGLLEASLAQELKVDWNKYTDEVDKLK